MAVSWFRAPVRRRSVITRPPRSLRLDLDDETAEGAQRSVRRLAAARAGLRRRRERGLKERRRLAQELLHEGELRPWARRFQAVQHVFVDELGGADAVGTLVDD